MIKSEMSKYLNYIIKSLHYDVIETRRAVNIDQRGPKHSIGISKSTGLMAYSIFMCTDVWHASLEVLLLTGIFVLVKFWEEFQTYCILKPVIHEVPKCSDFVNGFTRKDKTEMFTLPHPLLNNIISSCLMSQC